jgi:putative transposase
LIFGVIKTSRFNEGQIIKAIKEHEGGRKAEDIVRDLGISQGTFYKWKQKYGGMEASDVKRLKDLELENSRLKRLLADTILDKEILKDMAPVEFKEHRKSLTGSTPSKGFKTVASKGENP